MIVMMVLHAHWLTTANVLSFFFPLFKFPTSVRIPTQKMNAQALKDTGRATARIAPAATRRVTCTGG